MWKRYLEREDSKIVGMERGRAVGIRAWEKEEGEQSWMMRIWDGVESWVAAKEWEETGF